MLKQPNADPEAQREARAHLVSLWKRLGVIPMGLADGLAWLNAGRVLVRGVAAPIVTGPNLEHTRIDLTGVPEARVGDEVVIIGRQGEAEITAAEVGRRHGLGLTRWPPPSGPASPGCTALSLVNENVVGTAT